MKIQLASDITLPYSTMSIISGLFYFVAKKTTTELRHCKVNVRSCLFTESSIK